MAAYFKEYYPSGDLRCKEAPGRFFLLQGVLRTSFDNLYRISGTWIREICHVSYISPLFKISLLSEPFRAEIINSINNQWRIFFT